MKPAVFADLEPFVSCAKMFPPGSLGAINSLAYRTQEEESDDSSIILEAMINKRVAAIEYWADKDRPAGPLEPPNTVRARVGRVQVRVWLMDRTAGKWYLVDPTLNVSSPIREGHAPIAHEDYLWNISTVAESRACQAHWLRKALELIIVPFLNNQFDPQSATRIE